MRKCLSPFFIGREETGLERETGEFDVILPSNLIGSKPGSKNAINSINCVIRDFVADTITSGRRPLVLSGDCLSAIGSLAGLEHCGVQPYLLWFDANGDFHTPQTTISGHLGGMPLAMLTGRGDQSLLSAVKLTPLHDERVCHIGARDLESGEREAFEASDIRRVNRVTEVLKDLPDQYPAWVHFDTDYLNPTDAPAMRYLAKGGISVQAAKSDFFELSKKNILGISVSAWAPHLDVDGSTARNCWDVVSVLY